MNTKDLPFDPEGMASRKAAYFKFLRSHKHKLYDKNGACQPTMEPDGRNRFALFPALMDTDDQEELAWACLLVRDLVKSCGYNVFISSSAASNLMHFRGKMTPELVELSERHLAEGTVIDGGRKACASCNDYNFHGWNDNMPGMATRQLIFAGDLLGRKDFTDIGLLRLEQLCAHLQRRGLCAEHTSGTYTPITLTTIMEIAEHSLNKEARKMALACANRLLLDILCHWHQSTGALGGVQSRTYAADLTSSNSATNALLWYWTGSPLQLNPIENMAAPKALEGYVPYTRVWMFAEFMMPSYKLVAPGIVEFARKERPDDYTVRRPPTMRKAPPPSRTPTTASFGAWPPTRQAASGPLRRHRCREPSRQRRSRSPLRTDSTSGWRCSMPPRTMATRLKTNMAH